MQKIILLFAAMWLAAQLQAQSLAHFADSVRSEYHIPELSYAVVTSTKILDMAALGKHSVDLPDSASLGDRFHLGSNTKAMTAFVIAKFVERGKLDWDTPFFNLFPAWKANSRPEYWNITLQDLLSHRGLVQPFQGFDDPEIPDFQGTNVERRRAFGQFVLTTEPMSLDSANPYVYSNAGYTLAALMLEQATGKTWEQCVEKVLNHQLKLNVGFSWPENQQHSDTWGHVFEEDHWVPVASNAGEHLDFTEPAGDLNIRLGDYVKFLQINLLGLQGDRAFLKPATFVRIHNCAPGYALGWYNNEDNGHDFSTHAGTVGTYFALASIDRTQYRAYVIFVNAFNDETVQGVRILMRRLKAMDGD